MELYISNLFSKLNLNISLIQRSLWYKFSLFLPLQFFQYNYNVSIISELSKENIELKQQLAEQKAQLELHASQVNILMEEANKTRVE